MITVGLGVVVSLIGSVEVTVVTAGSSRTSFFSGGVASTAIVGSAGFVSRETSCVAAAFISAPSKPGENNARLINIQISFIQHVRTSLGR